MHLYVTQVTSIMGFCVECMCIQTSHVDACVYGGQSWRCCLPQFLPAPPIETILLSSEWLGAESVSSGDLLSHP